MQCPGLHLAIGIHDRIGQVTVEYVVAGGSVSAKLVAVLPVPEILGAIVALRMGCFGQEVRAAVMASDTLMGLAAEAGSPLAPISVFVESFSPVFPEEVRPSLIWPSIFDRSGFFNPADVCFLHGVFARKYLTDAGYCRQPELWGDRGPYSGLDDDDDGYEHDGQAAKDAGDGYAGLVFLDATTVSSSRTVR